MKLKELVEQALSKSPAFTKKYTYWTLTRKKKPDLLWLMKQLEQALGKKHVQTAAKEEIKKNESN